MLKTKVEGSVSQNKSAMSLTAELSKDQPDSGFAQDLLCPELDNAVTLMSYSGSESDADCGIYELTKALASRNKEIHKGDMTHVESLLFAQAQTLNSIFNNLARRACSAKYQAQLDINLKLAMKAQSQSRATMETLSKVKNPRGATFVKQANIARGHQQVNNTLSGQALAHPDEFGE